MPTQRRGRAMTLLKAIRVPPLVTAVTTIMTP